MKSRLTKDEVRQELVLLSEKAKEYSIIYRNLEALLKSSSDLHLSEILLIKKKVSLIKEKYDKLIIDFDNYKKMI